jgi:hypothetical protein
MCLEPQTGSIVARLDSNDSQALHTLFARKNFFADSFLDLRNARAKDFPRVAALQQCNTPCHQ